MANALDPSVVMENECNVDKHNKGLSMKIFMVKLLLLQVYYNNSIGAYALLGILKHHHIMSS